MIIRTILILLVLGFAQSAAAQGVDCGNPQGAAERTICSDRTLMTADREVLGALMNLRRAGGDARALRREFAAQERWKGYLSACGDDRACILRRLEARRLELEAMARGSRTLQSPATAQQQQGASQQMTAEQDGGGEVEIVVVEPDGTILKIGEDGFGDWYNPVTGTSGMVMPDGTRTAYQFMEIGDSEAPDLPSENSAWSAYLLDRAEAVARNVLSEEHLGYLNANAPSTHLARLDYTLDFVAFITGGGF